MSKYPKADRICIITLTHRCNLNCVYCFQKHKDSADMTLETAKEIVLKEMEIARTTERIKAIKFELFGGEPLLKFDMFKELCEWTWHTVTDVNYYFHITTNGTLLNDEIKAWLKTNRDKVRLIMSVDGTDDVQNANRGCNSSKLPIDFVLDVWPDQYLKMTMSKETLPKLASELIKFYEMGYRMEASVALGVKWDKEDGYIYEKQLDLLAEYYLNHPNVVPVVFFKKGYLQLTTKRDDLFFGKTCGAGYGMTAYDVDGKPYPCHLFLPNVHGDTQVIEKLNDIDFIDPARFVDDYCIKCPILRLCKTCCGFNYNQRGDVASRDRNNCLMAFMEAKVVSSYQINLLAPKRENLNDEELLQLHYAYKCYNICIENEHLFTKD